MKPYFVNLRLIEDMPAWQRLIWRILGEKLIGRDRGVMVTAYCFMHVTLVWRIETEGEELYSKDNPAREE